VDEVTVTLLRLPPKRVDDLIEKLHAHPGVVAVDS
jgi:tripartite-type tricarboxylate transporter receptor subunit TctC